MMNASEDDGESSFAMAEPDEDEVVQVQDAGEGDIALQERYVLMYAVHIVVEEFAAQLILIDLFAMSSERFFFYLTAVSLSKECIRKPITG